MVLSSIVGALSVARAPGGALVRAHGPRFQRPHSAPSSAVSYVLLTLSFLLLAQVTRWFIFLVREKCSSRRVAAGAGLRDRAGVCHGEHHFEYAVWVNQGQRPYMEDRWLVSANRNGPGPCSLYGVFDGHGGSHASQYCVDHLARMLFADAALYKHPANALTRCFNGIDKRFLEIARRGSMHDGTTAVVALVIGTRVYVANAGDSRCVLVHSDGSVTALSQDHKPNREDERARIQKAGGHVVFWGVWRTQGVLAVSRAIGDLPLKRFVTPDPEVLVRDLEANDSFLVLATDGLWDTVQSASVGQVLREEEDVQRAARRLTDLALRRGSTDNVCVMVVDVRNQLVGRAAGDAHSTQNSKKDL